MPTPIWLDYLAKLWPIVVVLSTIFGALIGVWLSSRYAPRQEFERLKNTVFEHTTQIATLEDTLKSSPTRQELQDDIAQLAERIRGLETGVSGMRDQLSTTNNYLHTLIEKGLQK
jgi:chromosome segregation ATPase